MITVIHYKGGYKAAYNSQGVRVLGTGYFTGRQKPNYPVPTTEADNCTALNYWHLMKCPYNPPCNVCIDDYIDGLEYDFPEAFE